MLTYHRILRTLQSLGLRRETPLIAHTAFSALGEVQGGVQTLLGALLTCVDNLMVPSSTCRTMVIPEFGPEDNAVTYGQSSEQNLNAEIFQPDLPSDPPENQLAEALRLYPDTTRSSHPILSFVGLGMDAAIESQTAQQPYAHIAALMNKGAQVLLLGAGPQDNFSLHYAEYQVGRKQFLRWALTPNGVIECPFFPGCPDGFQQVLPHLEGELRQAEVDANIWYAIGLDALISVATNLIKEDPFALLCSELGCQRCNAVRKSIRGVVTDS